jgi:hypothetical protein
MATAAHGERPNHMIHFDYLYMGEEMGDDEGAKYVLVLKDDYSGFTELVWSPTATADVVVEHLQAWFKRFGVVLNWVSDQGTHFTAGVMKELAAKLGVNHHYVTAYAPWANGTIERVNRDLLSVMRSLRLERPGVKWRDLLPLVQSSLNQTVSVSRGGYAPVTVMFGMEPTTPLTAYYGGGAGMLGQKKPLAKEYTAAVKSLSKRLDNIHKDVVARKTKMYDKSRLTGGKAVNFGIGDYVMLARAGASKSGKLQPTWRGPMEVVESPGPLVYVVRDLQKLDYFEAHAERLRFYHDKSLGLTAALIEASANVAEGMAVKSINGFDLEHEATGPVLLIQWASEAEPSWEPLAVIAQDLPGAVRKYIEKLEREAAGDAQKLEQVVRLKEQARLPEKKARESEGKKKRGRPRHTVAQKRQAREKRAAEAAAKTKKGKAVKGRLSAKV